MRKFLSNKSNLDIFKDTYFPQAIPVTSLEHTDASNNIEDAIENCVDFINDHGVFTVFMWCYRGAINDKYLLVWKLKAMKVKLMLVG